MMTDPYEFPNLQLDHHDSSFFSNPHYGLDPRLFVDGRLKPWVEDDLSDLVMSYLVDLGLSHLEQWLHIWLAGSGVSYLWAEEDSSDLDCLMGIEWTTFRQHNPSFMSMPNADIASWLNEMFYENLNKDHWHGFELTFYVNHSATDIRSINPYAAWDVRCSMWTVEPDLMMSAPNISEEWRRIATSDEQRVASIIGRYNDSKRIISDSSTHPSHRTNHLRYIRHALEEASALYSDIHDSRSSAFSPGGAGYSSFENYRWHNAKATGMKDVLSAMHDYNRGLKSYDLTGTFGADLPSVDTLLRRGSMGVKRELGAAVI